MQAQRAKPSTATENRERSAPAGRQAKPLCKAASAALLYLLYLLHLLHLLTQAVGASAPFPKAWRAKPAMPLQATGPCADCFVSFVSFVIPKTHWQSCRRQHAARLCVPLLPSVSLCVLPQSAVPHTGSPGRRGRTYRTNRTYRTAANAALHKGFACRALAARSVHCSLFTVLWGGNAALGTLISACPIKRLCAIVCIR